MTMPRIIAILLVAAWVAVVVATDDTDMPKPARLAMSCVGVLIGFMASILAFAIG